MLPACTRCASRGITCVYDLQPVLREHESDSPSTATTTGTTSTPVAGEPSKENFTFTLVYSSVEAARQASIAAVAEGHDARPLLMTDSGVSAFIVRTFADIARDGLASKGSPFIHRKIFRHELLMHHCDDVAAERDTIRGKIQALAQIHSLITLLLKKLLIERVSVKGDDAVEETVLQLFTMSRQLWEEPQTQYIQQLAPFEAWIVAESIRRAMFAAVFVRAFWWKATQGVVHYEPFFESLPFDPRAALWSAQTSEEWHGEVAQSGGAATRLVSYHEFIETSGGVLRSEQDGIFQRVLFVSYFGSPGILQLERLDSGRTGTP